MDLEFDFGLVSYRYHYGFFNITLIASFKCVTGYLLKGPKETYCITHLKKWYGKLPGCVSK